MADLLSLAVFKNIAGKSNVSDNNSAKSVQNVSGLNSKQENMIVDLIGKKQNLSSYVSSASKTSLSQNTSNSTNSCGKKVTLSEMIKPNNTSSSTKTNVSASDVLANMSKPVGSNSPQLGQKIDIKNFVNGVKTPKSASSSYDAKKSTTVTLNELASKCKKSDKASVDTTVKVETGVKKSVIGNALGIDSLVPKISLNSIGKSNSFFK